MKKKYEPLFEPFTFPSGVTIDNRIAVAPMTHYSSNEDGTISDQELDYIIPRSKEMGMVITACANVTADGKAFPGQPAINQDSQISGLKKLAQAIQAQGSKAIVQIHHGGIECPPELVPNQEVVGASDIFDNGKQIVRALEDHEVENIVKAFGEATRRAIEAGFDGVEIHGANGYLIQQFYSPKTNQRTDRWGGSAEKRLAFPLAIVDEVKKAIASHAKEPFALGYRLSPEEPETPGLTMAETFTLVDALAEKELDYLHISLMDVNSKARRGADETRTRMDLLNERVGNKVPLIAVGSIHTADEALQVIQSGIPLVAMGREILVDPQWPAKVKEGREEEIETIIKLGDKPKYHLPEPLWQMIINTPGWVPFED
ncbi:NADH-dependent flavin oxidoreductase [Bacillus atrophaeus]|uniref:NADH-dependent flavin oxidoreductase n=1 Tax=Bacillus atrophaeus TaxID=1452 RepID=UPI002DBD64CE|nr:NADH-dependent flavin oxidoreductase [Bacillus atrophaeus]MEC1903069.1 NADH-dependent flavin oxidoreductase [Bacillus atrophaeus]MEC2399052.1 NADH-dependent flavin oxidoreductase [Bacillus atrophaeus]MED4435530.1 NADH-dependent flavin oxidoreductase [Bacillus atrophaeus]MED4565658.1 NADH-dependent flavin oxidoreductase [Bacillus atrophaeus]MED4574262.1 NADH-dependent flavin oxidoreductase [Bacillus atrophaeus]